MSTTEQAQLIFDALNNKTSRLEFRVRELENALRYYGDSDNYVLRTDREERHPVMAVESDGGARARKILYGD